MNPNALALCLALLVGCGTVTADPHDAAGGAGGQLAAGGQGGAQLGAAGQGGAAGAPAGGAGGAAGAAGAAGQGGATYPTCPKTTECAVVVSGTCCDGCFAADGGALVTSTCQTTAWWSNSTAVGYCVYAKGGATPACP